MVFGGFRQLPSRAECFFLSFRILELELPAVCVGEIRYGMFGTRSQNIPSAHHGAAANWECFSAIASGCRHAPFRRLPSCLPP